jgi:hypothetical protein
MPIRLSKGDEARRIVLNIANLAEMMQRSRDQFDESAVTTTGCRGYRNTGEHAGREDEEVAHTDLRGTARRRYTNSCVAVCVPAVARRRFD